jgi:hypothetical protein
MAIKKATLFLMLFLSITFEGISQTMNEDVSDLSFSERIYFGGNFGIQFGTVTLINVSPAVGYRITNRFSAGPGITYMYYRENFAGFVYQTSIYGGRLFARYDILENVFLHSEYEILNLDRFDLKERINVTNILVGGGYRQHLGGRTYLHLLSLWNINDSVDSPYQNPIIRMGVNIGL